MIQSLRWFGRFGRSEWSRSSIRFGSLGGLGGLGGPGGLRGPNGLRSLEFQSVWKVREPGGPDGLRGLDSLVGLGVP